MVTTAVVALSSAAMNALVVRWRRQRTRMGARLRALRVAAALTQLDLAARSGVTHESISRLELGRRSPRAKTIDLLAKALDVSPEELLGVAETDLKD